MAKRHSKKISSAPKAAHLRKAKGGRKRHSSKKTAIKA